jgi:uncharacterized protein GlcG (DUF336 family)
MRVIDDAGALLLLERMDGVGSTTAEVAQRKARGRAVQAADQALRRSRKGTTDAD